MSPPPSTLPARPLVVVLDEGYGGTDVESAVLAPFGAVLAERPCRGSAEAVHRAVAGAQAVLVRESPVDRAALDAMPDCRAIVRYGVGVDNIDRIAAAARGIYVANVPDYGVEEVSDQALALLLAVRRRIVTRDRAVRAGEWNVARREPMHRLAGGVLGLVGYGRIARSFHRKATALGFVETVIFDPFLTDLPPATRPVPLDELCRTADVVSLHAPLTPETRHMIDADRLALMKPTAVLVNSSRGGLVDEAALVAALQAERIFGAGLDVYEQEPPAADNPLFALPNVVLSDHTGWYSEESVDYLRRTAAGEIARVFAGERPRNWVNPWNE